MKTMFNIDVKKILCFSVLVLLGIGSFTWAQNTSEKSYYYQSIEVDIRINPDSTFDVREKQTYNLTGSFGYFFRDIELKDLDHLSSIEVFDGEEKKLNKDEYDFSYTDNRAHIQWNFPRRTFDNELKSWIIKYKVHGGLGFYENHDELYWNAVFGDREVEVVDARVAVHLSAEVERSQIGQIMFIGKLGSKNQSSNFEIINKKTVLFWGDNIRPAEFLTVVVTWPKGYVTKPFLYRNQLINWLVLLLAIALPVFVFIRAYRVWKKSGQDPKIKRTIIAQYKPPEDLAPGVVGILIDQKFDVREVTATVIDLAVKGYLKVKEEKKSFFRGQQYTFEKIKDEKDLKPFEQNIMQGIFDKGNIVSSNDLKNKFYRRLSKIKKSLHQEIAKTGYLTGNIQEMRKKFKISYILIFILGIILLVLGAIVFSQWISLFILISISLFLSGIIGLIFGHYMPALTRQGAEEKWKWLGFKEYLHIAERFRIDAETVETFSKYLPYAIIFEVEKQWAKRFADLKYQAPNWYVPVMVQAGGGKGGTPSFSGLASNIASFTSSISSTFGSAPGGSGAGAGGGAGGGGGGGGGGAG